MRNTNSHAAFTTLQSVTTQAERLALLQEAAGFSTLAEFARAAGVEPGTARQQANRNSIPSEAALKYVRAARSTGATVEWLLFGQGAGPKPAPDRPAEPEQRGLFPAAPARRPQLAEAPAPPPVPTGKPDIPVWASAAAGDGDGAMILTSEPIDYIKRTERTATVTDPWAFHVIGDSMLERLAQGDQVVINPAMPLLPMTDCVFVHQADDGAMYALVKRLLRANSDVWRVRQLNPAKDFELSRKKWTKAYRIAEIRPRM